MLSSGPRRQPRSRSARVDWVHGLALGLLATALLASPTASGSTVSRDATLVAQPGPGPGSDQAPVGPAGEGRDEWAAMLREVGGGPRDLQLDLVALDALAPGLGRERLALFELLARDARRVAPYAEAEAARIEERVGSLDQLIATALRPIGVSVLRTAFGADPLARIQQRATEDGALEAVMLRLGARALLADGSDPMAGGVGDDLGPAPISLATHVAAFPVGLHEQLAFLLLTLERAIVWHEMAFASARAAGLPFDSLRSYIIEAHAPAPPPTSADEPLGDTPTDRPERDPQEGESEGDTDDSPPGEGEEGEGSESENAESEAEDTAEPVDPGPDPAAPDRMAGSFERLVALIDYAYLGAAAQDLALALTRVGLYLTDWVTTTTQASREPDAAAAETSEQDGEIREAPGAGADPLDALLWVTATRYGRIVISGTGDDDLGEAITGDTPLLLRLDLGGNDTHRAGGATWDLDHPVSILLDVAGDDTYTCDDPARPSAGAAIFGIAMLADFDGSDRYEARAISQAAAVGGIAVLLDRGQGEDRYTIERYGQGAATAGVAILLDATAPPLTAEQEEGTPQVQTSGDRYEAFREAQAYAGVRGSAMLIDVAGDDVYIARTDEVRTPAPQDATLSVSMCQGAAQGRRADGSDGHGWAGGRAMLVDLAGDDTYRAGVFGQGVGYWYGIGLLADVRGNDTYQAAWYGQGAAAHYAIGALVDGTGDDTYTITHSQGIGSARDRSIASFRDTTGNDTYLGADRSIGVGDIYGIGLFEDVAGDDTYGIAGWSEANEGERERLARRIGRALGSGWLDGTSPRWLPHLATVGLFLDRAGDDTYADPIRSHGPDDAASWIRPARPPSAGTRDRRPTGELGVGRDLAAPAR